MENLDIRVYRGLESLSKFPSITLYEGYCKLAAERCFQDCNEVDAVYHLSEAHSINLRHSAESSANYLLRRDASGDAERGHKLSEDGVASGCLNSQRWKSIVGFNRRRSQSIGRGLIERIKDMPKEWTIVQVTSAFDIHNEVNPEAHSSHCPPRLYVSRMECGPNPVVIASNIDLVPNFSESHFLKIFHKSSCATKSFLKELNDIVIDNVEVSKNGKSYKKARDYWEKRKEHNQRMKVLLNSIENHWLKGHKCFFLGKLSDERDAKKLEDLVDRVLKTAGCPPHLPTRSRTILSLLIGALPNVEVAEIHRILQDAFPGSSTQVIRDLMKAIHEVKEEIEQDSELQPWQWKRHPVILILDKRIECIPWEVMPTFQVHQYSRVPSIHFVHCLSLEASNKKREADVDTRQGYYLVNPDGSLPGTEERMVQYLERRPETWSGKRGTEPSSDEFLKAVNNHNLILYSGHGSGGKYFHSSLIHSGSAHVVMLLMGCGSVRTRRLAAKLDPWGTVYQYMLARSPCVVGMLWEVTDVECDLVTMKLLDTWLGPAKDGQKDQGPSERDELETGHLNHSRDNLLKALKESRNAAKQFMTSAAVVAYGIPVAAGTLQDVASLTSQLKEIILS